MLDISGTNFSGEGLSAIKKELTNLQDIYCERCDNLTDTGLKQILRLTKNSRMNFTIESKEVTGEGLVGFNVTLPKLKRVCMYECSNVTVTGVRQFERIFGKVLEGLKEFI